MTNQAIANAVQNTITTKTAPLAEVMKNLDKKDLAVAYKAVNDAYLLQGDIENAQAKITRAQMGIGDHVLTIAKQARVHCVAQGYDLVLTRHYFLALCDQAELALINKHVEDKSEKKAISTLIPVWPTHKSNIAKAMELKIDPTERMDGVDSPKYATATQYVNAMKEAVKDSGANKTGSQAGNMSDRKSDKDTAKTLSVITSTWNSSLQAAIQVLSQGLNRLDAEEQQAWAPKVLSLAAEVTTFADSDERKARLQAKADALKAAPVSGEIIEDVNGNVTGTSRSDEELDPGEKAALAEALAKEEKPKSRGRQRVA